MERATTSKDTRSQEERLDQEEQDVAALLRQRSVQGHKASTQADDCQEIPPVWQNPEIYAAGIFGDTPQDIYQIISTHYTNAFALYTTLKGNMPAGVAPVLERSLKAAHTILQHIGIEEERGRAASSSQGLVTGKRSSSPTRLQDTAFEKTRAAVNTFVQEGYQGREAYFAGERSLKTLSQTLMTCTLDEAVSVLHTLDQATLGGLSRVFEGLEFVSHGIGTDVRRALRDMTGNQRIAQNAGDLASLTLSFALPGAAFKVVKGGVNFAKTLKTARAFEALDLGGSIGIPSGFNRSITPRANMASLHIKSAANQNEPFSSLGIGKGASSSIGRTLDPKSAYQAQILQKKLKIEEVSGVKLPNEISGYSKHGINQAISREDFGVKTKAIKDAWKNPLDIKYNPTKYGPSFQFHGKDAVVVLNKDGDIITAWAKTAEGKRIR